MAAAMIVSVLGFDPTRPILALAGYANPRSSAISRMRTRRWPVRRRLRMHSRTIAQTFYVWQTIAALDAGGRRC